MTTIPLEQDTRALIDKALENLGWRWNGASQNIYFERAKTTEEQKKLKGKRPDYVLYPASGNNPLIVIEAKRKGARIDSALEQGIEYARAIGAPLVFATDGVFCKSYHTIDNCTPILNGQELDEFIREALAIKFLNNHEVNTVSPKVQYDRKELIKIFDEANNMLRGEGLRAGIERFGEFANILFLKLASEIERIKIESGEESRLDYFCHWDAIKEIPASARIEYINNTVYKRLNNLYNTEIFTPLCIRNENILSEIMDRLDPLMLTDVDSDVKGDAFEYFLKASTATKNDLGEYFTPRHIVKTMVRLINPQIGEKIYDPFCGTGGFLIESFRYIYNNMARTERNIEILKNGTVYGNEITNTARITKMNMILAGDGHSNIKMKDSLANPIDGNTPHNGFDVVITNMPYSQKTLYGSLYDIPSKNGDSVCVQHCMKAINSTAENGRMALVVPEGFLFRKDLEKTREYLLERSQLQSIISLPQGVFLPYTGVKTDIIYATNVNKKIKSFESKKSFWYFDVKSDGYTLDNHRRKLDSTSDLSKYEEYRKLDEEQSEDMMKVGFEIISIDKVRQNSYVFSGNRYRSMIVEKTEYSMIRLSDESYFSVCSGGTPRSSVPEYWNGDVKWITLSDLPADDYITEIKNTERTISELGLNNSNAKLIPIGAVIVSTRATIGRIGIARMELATNQGFKNIIIKRKDKILPEYLAYFLASQKDIMMNLASGATFKEISKENFCSIQVPLISIEKQRLFVDELDGYRRIINNAQAIAQNYKTNFRINPKWKTEILENICDFEYGYTGTALDKGDTRFIRITDINPDGTLSGNDCQYVILNKENEKYLLSKGDILVARIGATYGKTAIFDEEYRAIFASYLIRLKLNKKILPKYYFYYAQSEHYWNQARNLVSGAGQPQFNANAIKLINLPIPTIDEQRKIIEELDKESELIKQAKNMVMVFREKLKQRVKEIWNE